jgi:hypothetical protein
MLSFPTAAADIRRHVAQNTGEILAGHDCS